MNAALHYTEYISVVTTAANTCSIMPEDVSERRMSLL
jgi:hypothetical protein